MELTFEDATTAESRLREAFLDPETDLGLGGTITSRRQESDGTVVVRVHLYDDSEKDVPQEPGRE